MLAKKVFSNIMLATLKKLLNFTRNPARTYQNITIKLCTFPTTIIYSLDNMDTNQRIICCRPKRSKHANLEGHDLFYFLRKCDNMAICIKSFNDL